MWSAYYNMQFYLLCLFFPWFFSQQKGKATWKESESLLHSKLVSGVLANVFLR